MQTSPHINATEFLKIRFSLKIVKRLIFFRYSVRRPTLIPPCDVGFPSVQISFSAAMMVAQTDFCGNVSFRCSPSLINHTPTFFSMLEYLLILLHRLQPNLMLRIASQSYLLYFFPPFSSIQQFGQLTLKHELRSEVAIVLVYVEELQTVDEKAEDEIVSIFKGVTNSLHPPSWNSYNHLTTAVKIKCIS
jgi:hypothetical protein